MAVAVRRFEEELKIAPQSPVRNARVLHFNKLGDKLSNSTEKGFQQDNLPSPVRSHSTRVLGIVGIGFRCLFRH
jgi:hypothetical protein